MTRRLPKVIEYSELAHRRARRARERRAAAIKAKRIRAGRTPAK